MWDNREGEGSTVIGLNLGFKLGNTPLKTKMTAWKIPIKTLRHTSSSMVDFPIANVSFLGEYMVRFGGASNLGGKTAMCLF